MNNTENDEWGTDKHIGKCNDCDFTGTISTLERITCSKLCGYATYECDDCGWEEKNKKVIIENKLESIQLKEHIKYILYVNGQNGIKMPVSSTLIWICNQCQKNDDEEKLITNMKTLVNSVISLKSLELSIGFNPIINFSLHIHCLAFGIGSFAFREISFSFPPGNSCRWFAD